MLSFTVVASLLVMSPGPNGVLIAKTVPISGKAAGFTNIAGFVAAFPQFILLSGEVDSPYLLVFIHSVINLVWFSGMVFLFSQLTGAGSNRTFQKVLKTTTGLVFIGFGAKLASLRPQLFF